MDLAWKGRGEHTCLESHGYHVQHYNFDAPLCQQLDDLAANPSRAAGDEHNFLAPVISVGRPVIQYSSIEVVGQPAEDTEIEEFREPGIGRLMQNREVGSALCVSREENERECEGGIQGGALDEPRDWVDGQTCVRVSKELNYGIGVDYGTGELPSRGSQPLCIGMGDVSRPSFSNDLTLPFWLFQRKVDAKEMIEEKEMGWVKLLQLFHAGFTLFKHVRLGRGAARLAKGGGLSLIGEDLVDGPLSDSAKQGSVESVRVLAA